MYLPQRLSLGPLFFLIHIDNLSSDIVSLVKQKYVPACVCAYVSVIWLGDLQIQLEVPFLGSCIGKINEFLKFLVVESEEMVLKL